VAKIIVWTMGCLLPGWTWLGSWSKQDQLAEKLEPEQWLPFCKADNSLLRFRVNGRRKLDSFFSQVKFSDFCYFCCWDQSRWLTWKKKLAILIDFSSFDRFFSPLHFTSFFNVMCPCHKTECISKSLRITSNHLVLVSVMKMMALLYIFIPLYKIHK